MYKKIVINVSNHETRVALLEDETVVELFIERGDGSDITGNIYKGRIQRVLPGMQAAFVDIGRSQAAFIYVGDVIAERDEYSELFEDRDGTEERPNFDEDEGIFRTVDTTNTAIEEMIKEGQEILVQVKKASMGTKGPRVTTEISLPGRYLVLMPKSDHIGISRRIEDELERSRLKELVLSLRKDNYGYIVRTAAEGINRDKIASEMEFLCNLWNSIQRKYKNSSAPALLHRELNISLRAVRDLMIYEADKLIIDSETGYEAILSFLDTFAPSLKTQVEIYEGNEPIFDFYNFEGDITRALKKKVWLKSGGYILIEHTEALVAIDVNTGRYVGKYNLEETILKTNLEAVKEIAYQIRLRDIGGIIIIDFIDMTKESNRQKVYNALKEALQKDKSKTHVLPMSEMGLIQMTRKRIRESLTRKLCEPCFYCDGEGYLISKQSVCYNIYREILREAMDFNGAKVTVKVNPEIAEIMHDEEKNVIVDLERKTGKHIIIYPNSQFHMEEFDILEHIN
jgi:ribonuclease G